MISLKKRFIKSQASQKYKLKLRVSDHGEDVLSSDSEVDFIIINKDQPMFDNNYFGEVTEDAQIGNPVAKVMASGPENRQVYYQIVRGDDYQQFHVGFTSGNSSFF